MTGRSLHICLIAGEPSGDVLGGRLMAALKDRIKAQGGAALRFSGVGGATMKALGLTPLFPMDDLSVMGIAEVLPRLPKLLKRIGQTSRHIIENKPDIVITIDSPDFSFRVAKKVRGSSDEAPYMVHYVAPTVWAWRPGRAKKVAALYDMILCLFPFEPSYFKTEGMNAVFTGHPMIESRDKTHSTNGGEETSENKRTLGVFFGSRGGEIKRMGPVYRDVLEKFAETHPETKVVSPTFSHLEDDVRALLAPLPLECNIVVEPENKWEVFSTMDFAMATSGTVGLELAVADVPHVIGYKMNPLTWWMVKPRLTTDYAHLGNILLDRLLVPEFIQKDCTADALLSALSTLVENENIRKKQEGGFETIRERLEADPEMKPSDIAARSLLAAL